MTRLKKRTVPATTNNITRGIVNFLNANGHCAFRVNTAGVFDKSSGRYRRMPESSLGCPDVIACMQHHVPMTPNGLFYGFEIKNADTGDRLSADQKRFHERIRNAAGGVVVIRSYSQFLEWYHTIFK